MGHNKWMVACLGCLVACAVPGGLGKMWGVCLLMVATGGCFFKWLIEEDKYQKKVREEEEKMRKRG